MKYFEITSDYKIVPSTQERLNLRVESNIKRPENARKVYEGVIFTVYNWDQKLFDGTTATFESIKRFDTVNVIPITSKGKFIMTKQEQPGTPMFTGSIGGRVDLGESFVNAALRELKEESGISANELIHYFDYNPGTKIDWVVKTFFVKDLTYGESKPDAGEKIELAQYSFDEFIDVVTSDGCRDHEISYRVLKMLKNNELGRFKTALLG